MAKRRRGSKKAEAELFGAILLLFFHLIQFTVVTVGKLIGFIFNQLVKAKKEYDRAKALKSKDDLFEPVYKKNLNASLQAKRKSATSSTKIYSPKVFNADLKDFKIPPAPKSSATADKAPKARTKKSQTITLPTEFTQKVSTSNIDISNEVEVVEFSLDSDRIAQLQAETEKVSIFLGDIFKDDAEASLIHPAAQPIEGVYISGKNEQGSILSLDSSHTAFARRLLARAEWSRDDLLLVASEYELMLDGSLMTINEASFDIFDIAFTEGDDPITINPEILEKLDT